MRKKDLCQAKAHVSHDEGDARQPQGKGAAASGGRSGLLPLAGGPEHGQRHGVESQHGERARQPPAHESIQHFVVGMAEAQHGRRGLAAFDEGLLFPFITRAAPAPQGLLQAHAPGHLPVRKAMAHGGIGLLGFHELLRFLRSGFHALQQRRLQGEREGGQPREQGGGAGLERARGQMARHQCGQHGQQQRQRQPAAARLRQQRGQQPHESAARQRGALPARPRLPKRGQAQQTQQAQQQAEVAILDGVGVARGAGQALNKGLPQGNTARAPGPGGHAVPQRRHTGAAPGQHEQARQRGDVFGRAVQRRAVLQTGFSQKVAGHAAHGRRQRPGAGRHAGAPPLRPSEQGQQQQPCRAPRIARRQPQSQPRHHESAQPDAGGNAFFQGAAQGRHQRRTHSVRCAASYLSAA